MMNTGPRTLKNWRGRRAGGAIPVTGQDANSGADVRIAGVTELRPRVETHTRFFGWLTIADPYIEAVMVDGTIHILEL